MRKLFLVFILLTLSSICFADVILLKSGKKWEGEIKERTDKYVKVRINEVDITFWLDEIDRINDSVVSSDKEEANVQVTADYKTDSLQDIDNKEIFLERLSLAFSKIPNEDMTYNSEDLKK